MRSLARHLVALFLACISLSAVAQQSVLIPCEGAPADAVLKLPPPLDRWGQVYCTIYGHSVAARERWIWSFPGAFAPVHLPAQMVRDKPIEVNHGSYFKTIEVVALAADAANDAAGKINGKLGTRPDSDVAAAFRLTLTNQEGHQHVVLFVQTVREVELGKGHWGYWCDSECKDGMPFMLLNYEVMKK